MGQETKIEIQTQPEENLVKKTCRELGITQKELAEMMGVTERSLSRYAIHMPKNIEKYLKLINDNFIKTEILNSLQSTLEIAQNKIYMTL
jgi:transcriptional regulator with XRE-family HTH domain